MTIQGIPASSGLGIGPVVILGGVQLDFSKVSFSGVQAEKERLQQAVAVFEEKTSAIAQQMTERVGEKQAEILLGQIAMLNDPYMLSQIEEGIEQENCAEKAVDTVCSQFIDLFSMADDELTRQRAADIRDLRDRLLGILLGVQQTDLSDLPPNAVLVAKEFTPSMTSGIQQEKVSAIVAESGGYTSHAAILARCMELPAVLSVPKLTETLTGGEMVIVDGDEGTVLVEPDAKMLAEYRARQSAKEQEKAGLVSFQGQPTSTVDGETLLLYANIGSPGDLPSVLESTAEGIGLFRTEFLFMDRSSMPDEEEQFSAYRAVAEGMQDKEVIIRTLDIGGDKALDYLGLEKEENPFLGFRAIRYCLSREDVFKTQLRAILRASVYGDIKLMFPMVDCVAELNAAKALLHRAMEELAGEGVRYDREIAVGVMIETPAAAFTADLLAKEADFFSIGTNDLCQYIMAADRGNGKVAILNSPLQPAVLRAIRQVIGAAKTANIPVGMCGEAAADPLMLPLLVSFGLEEFSVSPSAVLPTRRRLSLLSKHTADKLAQKALSLSNEQEIRAMLKSDLKDIY